MSQIYSIRCPSLLAVYPRFRLRFCVIFVRAAACFTLRFHFFVKWFEYVTLPTCLSPDIHVFLLLPLCDVLFCCCCGESARSFPLPLAHWGVRRLRTKQMQRAAQLRQQHICGSSSGNSDGSSSSSGSGTGSTRVVSSGM